MKNKKIKYAISSFLICSLIFATNGVSSFAINKGGRKVTRSNLKSVKNIKAIDNLNRLDPQKPEIININLDNNAIQITDLVKLDPSNSEITITNKKGKLKFKTSENINPSDYEVIDNKIIYSGDKA